MYPRVKQLVYQDLVYSDADLRKYLETRVSVNHIIDREEQMVRIVTAKTIIMDYIEKQVNS